MSDARTGGLAGLRVATFESRRGDEVRSLIEHHGGLPLVAPSLVEEVNDPAPVLEFAAALLRGEIDVTVLLTGTGVKKMADIIEAQHPRAEWLAALARTTVVARSGKPTAALKTLGAAPPAYVAAEPHTWREVLAAMAPLSLEGRMVAIQEYGVPAPELLDGLTARGARLWPVPVYSYQLPADLAPLRQAIAAIAQGEADVLFFTAGVQVLHLLQVARAAGLEDALRAAFARMVVASVGPSTREVMVAQEVPVDMEPEHPRMGALLHELALRATEVLAAKRAGA